VEALVEDAASFLSENPSSVSINLIFFLLRTPSSDDERLRSLSAALCSA
jgi:hypothetical protein